MLILEKEIRERLGSQRQVDIGNNYEIWLDCYHGEPYWLNGKVDKQSLNLCVSIPSELAKLTTIELETKVTDETLNGYYQKLIKSIRRYVEYGLGLGGIIFKAYKAKGDIAVDVVTPDMFVILGFTTFGDINHIVFLDRIKRIEKDKYIYYTRLEEHIVDKEYNINNTVYKSNNLNSLGDEINIELVDEWQDMNKTTTVDSDIPLFTYFKNPQANNLDLKSQEGISCFARALSLIQDADEQYQRICWEYKGSELAVHADITALKQSKELPEGKDRLFVDMGLDSKDGTYNVFSPNIRDISLYNGLNKILRQVEFQCGLAYGTLSEVVDTAKTATEIKMSKQRSYSTVVDIQNELKDRLTEFVDILAYWCKDLKISVSEKYEVTFDFDDSLVVDTESERTAKLNEVAAQIISPEQYLKDVYRLEDVTDMMPNIEEKHTDVIEEE